MSVTGIGERASEVHEWTSNSTHCRWGKETSQMYLCTTCGTRSNTDQPDHCFRDKMVGESESS